MSARRGSPRRAGACFVLCLLAAMAPTAAETPDEAESAAVREAAPAEDEQEDADPEAAAGRWVRGAFETTFDWRSAGGDTDARLHQSLRLDVAPPAYPKLRIRGLFWATGTLDSPRSRTSALRGIDDSYGSDVRARVLHLYAELDDLWGSSTLRIGRQRILEGPVFNRIDGLYFSRRHENGVTWYAFGGARASVYEDAHEDLVFGGGASYVVTPHTRVALDYYYGEESRRGRDEVRQGPFSRVFGWPYPYRIRGDLSSTSLAVSVRQELTPNLQGFGRFIVRDGNADEILLDLIGFKPEADFVYQLTYRARLRASGDRVNDLTNFYRVLGPAEKYQHILAAAHKGLTEKLTLSLEAEWHDASNDDRRGNRDYVRFAGILSGRNLAPGVDASVSLERWVVGGGEGAWAVTGEISRKWTDVNITLGVDYEYYMSEALVYEPLPSALEQLAIMSVSGVYIGTLTPLVRAFDRRWAESRENIYAFYGRAKWSFSERQTLDARVTYQTDDGPQSPYWRAQVSYALQF